MVYSDGLCSMTLNSLLSLNIFSNKLWVFIDKYSRTTPLALSSSKNFVQLDDCFLPNQKYHYSSSYSPLGFLLEVCQMKNWTAFFSIQNPHWLKIFLLKYSTFSTSQKFMVFCWYKFLIVKAIFFWVNSFYFPKKK